MSDHGGASGGRPRWRPGRAGLRAATVAAAAVCLGAAGPVTTTCSVSGLAETEAILKLTRKAGRIDSFRYYMSRPVGLSAHECSVTAARGKGADWRTGWEASEWSDTRQGTRVVITTDISDKKVMIFAPRPNGTRLTFVSPTDCGTFMLPEAVEFRWSKRGCHGRAIGWPAWASGKN
ncbi:MAG: hypothetical protein KY449_11730 [Proteobacteria bacterium]|nr:hypothetical protein [Pseudomonadota bacterium]